MGLNNSNGGKHDDLKLVVQTSNGDLHLLGATKRETKGKVNLNLTVLEEINVVGVETAGSVAGLLSINNGERFPLDVDEEFEEMLLRGTKVETDIEQ